MNWIEYKKGLPLSEEIYNKFNPPPATHKEWAERFNKIGDINEIILKLLQNRGDESNNNPY